jgi:Co/Zn/Cd efflux system component
MYAEWYKDNYRNTNSNNTPIESNEVLLLEICIPATSLTLLLTVTCFVTYDAIRLLEHPPKKDEVEVVYLYFYAVLNLVVDLICGALFFFSGQHSGFSFNGESSKSRRSSTSVLEEVDDEEEDEEEEERERHPSYRHSGSGSSPSASASASGSVRGGRKNLNMLSAFTHVLGDTLRTVAVFTAAAVSTLTGIDGDICDVNNDHHRYYYHHRHCYHPLTTPPPSDITLAHYCIVFYS